MASLIPDPNGTAFRLQFSVPGHARRTVRLSAMGEDAAERAKHHVEVAIRAHKRQQPVPVGTLDWLFQVAPRNLLTALSGLGVVDDRRMLSDALHAWLMTKLDLSEKRVAAAERTADNLGAYLGNVEIEAITPEQLERWALKMHNDGAALNTVSTYTGLAKQFFVWAVRERLIKESPASKLDCHFEASERLTEVPSALVEQLCGAAAGELAVALRLARWGGLRAAEILRVRVADVNCEERALLVRDTKRGRTRRLPVFPELDCVIDAILQHPYCPAGVAMEGRCGRLLPELSQYTTSAMDQRALRLAHSIGIERPQRFWQNMRATRESELMDDFSLKDVCKWIGNSPDVAMRHYALVRGVEFDRAAGRAA